MEPISAAIGAGASLASGAMAAKAAKDAAKLGRNASNRELGYMMDAAAKADRYSAPYREAGYTALDALMSMTGLGGGAPSTPGSYKGYGEDEFAEYGGADPSKQPWLESGMTPKEYYWDQRRSDPKAFKSAYSKKERRAMRSGNPDAIRQWFDPTYGLFGNPTHSLTNQDPPVDLGGSATPRSAFIKDLVDRGVLDLSTSGLAMGGPAMSGQTYNINEIGPENYYSGGAITRTSQPRTIRPVTQGYVRPHGRAIGGQVGPEFRVPPTSGGYNDAAPTGGSLPPATQPPAPTGVAPQENPGGVDGGYNFMTEPGYEFRVGEGMRALERSAAAKGLLGSGGHPLRSGLCLTGIPERL
jgi:hypothetical protein